MDNIAELKRSFLEHLPERIGNVERAWRSLRNGEWDLGVVEETLERLEALIDACGKYGLVRVINQLTVIQLLLASYISETAKPDPDELERLEAKFRALRQEFMEKQENAAAGAHKKTVYFLRRDESNAPGLVDALGDLDLMVLTFPEPNGLLPALAKRPPDVFLFDGRHLDQLPSIREMLAQNMPEDAEETPIVCINGTQDLSHRVQALRSGVRVYFVAPLNNPGVCRRILELADRQPRHARIMIVEDEATDAQYYTTVLEKAGMHVLTVSKPTEALEALEEFRPDLVLMDLYMPEINGEELTRIIRERPGFLELPIVFLSGEQSPDRQLAALSAGGDDFLSKPVRPSHLIKTIENRLDRVQAMQRKSAASERGADGGNKFNLNYLVQRIEELLSTRHGKASQFSHALIHIGFPRGDQLKLDLSGQSDNTFYDIVPIVLGRLNDDDIVAGLGDNNLAVCARRVQRGQLFDLAATIYETLRDHCDRTAVAGLHVHPCVGIRILDPRVRSAEAFIRQAAEAYQLIDDAQEEIARHFGPVPKAEDEEIRQSARCDLLAETIRQDRFKISFLPVVDRADRDQEYYEMMLVPTEWGLGQQGTGKSLRREARECHLLELLDRRALMHGIGALEEARDRRDPLRLFVEQSISDLQSGIQLDWLRAQFRSRQLTGSGLILEIPAPEIGNEFARLRIFFGELQKMGISLCLSEFRITGINLKLIRFLKIDLVRLARDNPKASLEEVIGAFAQVRDAGARIVLPRIDNPHDLPKTWLSQGDLIPSLFGNAGRRG